MTSINREQLKQEIDNLDGAYLELAYNIIRQFPHLPAPEQTMTSARPKISFSQRWRGKLAQAEIPAAELESDPRLAYLSKRYGL